MTHVTIRKSALSDIEKIHAYFAQFNESAADRVHQMIKDSILGLELRPTLGHNRRDIVDKSYRFINVKPYVVCYRIDGLNVVVVRVLHGSRDFGRLFRQRKRP